MPDWTGIGRDTAEVYRTMARAFAGTSPTYRRLCEAVAADPPLLRRLTALPPAQRQPLLLLGAVRYLEGPVEDPAAFLTWTAAHWDDVLAVVTTHRTQTNEPRRCATWLPALSGLPGPLALVEVGASAGLCLLPDRWSYRYRTRDGEYAVGDGPGPLVCAVSGRAPLPDRLPEVVWRVGLDLHPLDVTDADDVRWLRALIWPEHHERFAVLDAAVRLARADPPRVVAGDLRTDLVPLVAQAPRGATVVVVHTATLGYLREDDRARFAATVRGLGRTLHRDVVWVGQEEQGLVARLPDDRPPGRRPYRFVLTRDGEPLALTGAHGEVLEWGGVSATADHG